MTFHVFLNAMKLTKSVHVFCTRLGFALCREMLSIRCMGAASTVSFWSGSGYSGLVM